MLETTDLRTKLQRAEAVALKASQELLQVKQQAQQQASAGGNGGGNSSAGNSGGASANRRPARALRRVEDGEGGSWLLFEFEGGVREWRRFSDEVNGLCDVFKSYLNRFIPTCNFTCNLFCFAAPPQNISINKVCCVFHDVPCNLHHATLPLSFPLSFVSCLSATLFLLSDLSSLLPVYRVLMCKGCHRGLHSP